MLIKHADKVIFFTVFILIVLGMVMLVSASSELAKLRFDDPYFFVRRQLTYGLSAGIVGFLICLLVPYKFFKKISFSLLVVNIILLAAVFSPLGEQFGAASRWLNIGLFTFQPSEILKFTFIVYLAAWLTSKTKDRKGNFFESVLPFLIISGFITFLLIKQPSTSAVIILMSAALILYFVHGVKISYILSLVFIGFFALVLIISFSPYRLQRIVTFLNPGVDLQASRFHINQSLIAIGSGGFFGVGYGNSISKIRFLPEPIGDSIFAIIAEEFGFLGSFLFIFLFFILISAGFFGSKKIRNPFGKLILIGFSSLIGIQAFVHIAAISGLIPLTGIPLPFISYGGSALATFMSMSGLMINVLKNA
ncbi:MAG: putative lipid II flippase FtsW [Candidatus Liptonbacteria bacterium]|nr:putative lipid II flippase FtsW [Candidatus Liptonbacteria bacterium]